ncbi:bacillithiol biosynthesis cysteine-adding enzyme BshC [Paenibacillus sp. HN-1]|uniref:bacillithiol biosynthesis cysteine-adding enzyme BshC n=1 Tax=Paenibacillus TaxID=44249 RepID=UPI001CA7D11C|nr:MULTISPECIES: bacillithiol biosynthesis cysteine-adding enzyme BshC [Paenibacillus]MBY9076955.1 bacillithiol biosynthesis cysteine-adding enzyme BshC [Paenibacillus sp. CGMCC 1.18879]MBY9086220.1 bacillithiol biosynthesis cysteine-adding enzyme BshC [Paenibacillus sinensis]
MNVVPEPLPGGPALAQAFLRGDEKVSHLFGGSYQHASTRQDRAAWLDSQSDSRVDRSRLTEVLRSYNARFNHHEAVRRSLDLLEQPETLVISGGQQGGLFTGPLLVIYKAITAIIAAREAAAELGRPVVPVFWIAGEDHDWDEVNHTYVLDRSGEVVKVKVEREDAGRSSVSCIQVSEEDFAKPLEQLGELLQESEFKQEIMELATHAARHGSMTSAFAGMLGALLGRFGLILLDSADPALRALEQPQFRALIERNDDLEAAYHKAADDIVSGGHELQADVAEGGANLFYIHEGMRLLLVKKDGRFTDRKGRVAFSKEELLDLLERHPERFSNNVLTRPLMQEYLLPVLATVLGQGEISYWGITGRAFAELSMKMPPILPRMSYTVVEGTLHKHMEKYGLIFEDVREGLEEKKRSWLEAQDELQLSRKFDEIKVSFAAMYEPLIGEIGTVQAGLLKLGAANKEKILDQIDFLESKVMTAMAKQSESALRQWERIECSLMPLGRLQERVYNITYYLNKYGLSWLEQLLELPADYTGAHRVLYM